MDSLLHLNEIANSIACALDILPKQERKIVLIIVVNAIMCSVNEMRNPELSNFEKDIMTEMVKFRVLLAIKLKQDCGHDEEEGEMISKFLNDVLDDAKKISRDARRTNK